MMIVISQSVHRVMRDDEEAQMDAAECVVKKWLKSWLFSSSSEGKIYYISTFYGFSSQYSLQLWINFSLFHFLSPVTLSGGFIFEFFHFYISLDKWVF